MHLICVLLFVLSATVVACYDLKSQEIPFIPLLINYVCLCCLTNYFLLFGIFILLFALHKDLPIDWLYVGIIGYLILIEGTPSIFTVVMLALITLFTVFSGKKISFMVPLEAILVTMILI